MHRIDTCTRFESANEHTLAIGAVVNKSSNVRSSELSQVTQHNHFNATSRDRVN